MEINSKNLFPRINNEGPRGGPYPLGLRDRPPLVKLTRAGLAFKPWGPSAPSTT